jgi:hypothetical protein
LFIEASSSVNLLLIDLISFSIAFLFFKVSTIEDFSELILAVSFKNLLSKEFNVLYLYPPSDSILFANALSLSRRFLNIFS